MSIKSEIKRALSLSPAQLISKLLSVAHKRINTPFQRFVDSRRTTYFTNSLSFKNNIITNYFLSPSLESLQKNKIDILFLSNKFLNHEFNLLGSDWIQIKYGMSSNGIEGIKYPPGKSYNSFSSALIDNVSQNNLDHSKSISELIDPNYKMIDWNIDFRSGFKWNPKSWSKDIQYGSTEGADIKMPWELGRLQHLPFLTYSYILTKDSPESLSPELYTNEFQNIILDFISSNPPRFGCQWMTSMDISIRVMNWLLSYDLFKSAGADFKPEFESIFIKSIYEHGKHIIANLEWASGMRGNHYLANIAGLLFISAYLPESDETLSWLAFALQELTNEIMYQFNPDGSNFEASSAYHLFSSEIVFYSLLLISLLKTDKIAQLKTIKTIKLPTQNTLKNVSAQKHYNIDNNNIYFSKELSVRINSIGMFILNQIANKRIIPQIGDNDSGRLFIFSPSAFPFSHSSLQSYANIVLSVFANLIQNNSLQKSITFNTYESEMLTKLNINNIFNNYFDKYNFQNILENLDINHTSHHKQYGFSSSQFQDFGLYQLTTANYHSSIRSGSIGQYGKGGHAHNDQLSICLDINGLELFVDPGTYVYTSFHKERNNYRSTHSHNTLHINGLEQNSWAQDSKDDLFWLLGDKTKSEVIKFTDNQLIAVHHGFGAKYPHLRSLNFHIDAIQGTDSCAYPSTKKILFHLSCDVLVDDSSENSITLNLKDNIVELSFDNGKAEINDYYYSPSYGVKLKSKCIEISFDQEKINWKIDIISLSDKQGK